MKKERREKWARNEARINIEKKGVNCTSVCITIPMRIVFGSQCTSTIAASLAKPPGASAAFLTEDTAMSHFYLGVRKFLSRRWPLFVVSEIFRNGDILKASRTQRLKVGVRGDMQNTQQRFQTVMVQIRCLKSEIWNLGLKIRFLHS